MSETHREHRESSVESCETLCPQCGADSWLHRHCHTICEACGYVESCEDNFVRPHPDSWQHADPAG